MVNYSSMKGLLLKVTERELENRRRIGLDRWDEMWEGILHMAPAPAFEHQRLQLELGAFLLSLLRRTGRGTLAMAVNVFNESSSVEDYRIPDFSFVGARNLGNLRSDGIRGGPPDAVVEIKSPDDETYEKLPFFRALGVKEVIVVDRDSKEPEVFRLGRAGYESVSPDAGGGLLSHELGVRLLPIAGKCPGLRVEDAGDPSTATVV